MSASAGPTEAADANSALRRVCIFRGANPGRDPRFAAPARDLGDALARAGIGGDSVGLKDAVADAALEAGGDVVGIIPRALRRGLAHASLPDLRPVGSMHEREAMMVASLGMR